MAVAVFLEVPESEWIASNGLAFAFHDRYPVAPGHVLVVTRRVVDDWFAATDAERTALMALVDVVKRLLDDQFQPHGYNVGFNAGTAAGQTVMHLHVHVIPRFRGDMDDPRGGIRHVIPSKGNYLREVQSLATGAMIHSRATCSRYSIAPTRSRSWRPSFSHRASKGFRLPPRPRCGEARASGLSPATT